MKTTIKILILIAGIAACVGGVMYYAKTKVAPPEVPATCNQYRQHLNQLLSAFSTTNTTTTNDSILSAAVVATNIFHREGKLTAPEADTFLVSFVNAYTPLFRQQAQSQFKQSAWPAQNILPSPEPQSTTLSKSAARLPFITRPTVFATMCTSAPSRKHGETLAVPIP